MSGISDLVKRGPREILKLSNDTERRHGKKALENRSSLDSCLDGRPLICQNCKKQISTSLKLFVFWNYAIATTCAFGYIAYIVIKHI